MSAPILFILNVSSGKGHHEEQVLEYEELFKAAGAEVSVVRVGKSDRIPMLTRRAAAKNPETIIAGGGDGTISAVASVLAGTPIALGVFPLGTLNHFARDLQIPLEPKAAAQAITAGNVVRVDVGEVNGRIFLNNSSLGLYPDMVRRREDQQSHGRGKWSAMSWAFLTVFRRYPFLTVRLRTDQQESECQTPFVFIGNNEYTMSGFRFGQRASLDAGRLSLYVARREGRLGLLALFARAVFGRLHQAKDFEALTAPTIAVTTRRQRLLVSTDGEIETMANPLQYRILPGALRVIVPRDAKGWKGKVAGPSDSGRPSS